jgi:hypothetical protein
VLGPADDICVLVATSIRAPHRTGLIRFAFGRPLGDVCPQDAAYFAATISSKACVTSTWFSRWQDEWPPVQGPFVGRDP